jgi:hypothetical protein
VKLYEVVAIVGQYGKVSKKCGKEVGFQLSSHCLVQLSPQTSWPDSFHFLSKSIVCLKETRNAHRNNDRSDITFR